MTTSQHLIERPENLLAIDRFINPNEPTGLWWCKDAIDMDTVQINAVCKDKNVSWNCINDCSEWLAQFPYILIAIPPGPTQDEVIQELSIRSPIPILVPCVRDFYGANSIAEMKENIGLSYMDALLINAEEVQIEGLINIADIDIKKRKNAKRIISGIPELDKRIGGFVGGELSVWTGKRGEGKSTLLGQILLDTINQNHTVCVYSGELPSAQFKLSLLQQAAGHLHVTQYDDPYSGKTFYNVNEDVIKYIDEWWNGKLFLTDIGQKNAHDENTIMKLFEYSNRRYGADVFLLDNIMTAELRNESTLGFYRAQSVFTGRLVAFCKRLNVHVHLVAHPRKTDNKSNFGSDDVSGSGDITNRADNVFKVERIPEDKLVEKGYSSILTIMKNRESGAQGAIPLDFNEPSRRFFQAGGSPAKRYSWEKMYEYG